MSTDNSTYSLILLAGGNSERMGEDKALKLLKGKTFIDHILEASEEITDHQMIISDHLNHHKRYEYVLPDLIKNKGPLGGIYTGLYHSKTKVNFVVSCDTPFINKKVFESLLLHNNPNYEVIHYKNNPLIGIYKKELSNFLHQTIVEDKLSVRKALSQVKTKTIHNKHLNQYVKNINTPEQFTNALKNY
ncbi:molybdenum cofactor guanylyltransferase [Aquimarina brevivitae]|uniref:Probable molybdenum cofactor guanylyltransferase n=1 Tax=Aquimarina brevivitae TaxID=323412 RepID=A0A4Q7NZT2_9FLAO|nr:molybdenum cofactor guanylyltransferase [Aquimarina brevivitae]RZS92528.1 molybdenum cofactor guanylyltransferase [Aquimarina brevivitae]